MTNISYRRSKFVYEGARLAAPENPQGILVRPINDPTEGLIATPVEIVAWVSKEPVQ